MSTHQVNVIEIKKEKHPNADLLSIVRIPGTEYTVVVATEGWNDGQLAAYIEPDYVVPETGKEFEFLKEKTRVIESNGVKGFRIKVKKLRGIVSMGLLVPAPEGSKIGDNVLEQLGIARYEPPINLSTFGEVSKAPSGVYYKYDIESCYKYAHLFDEGEEVIITEKIHGASARFVYLDGEMYCGSRTEWKKQSKENLWWEAFDNCKEIENFCIKNPGLALYGEVFGQVQDLRYGANNGEVFFAAFDILKFGYWMNHDEAREIASNVPWVPIIDRRKWNKEEVFKLADGESIVAKSKGVKQIREGIVIKPIKERQNDEIGRVQLKIVSNSYLERS